MQLRRAARAPRRRSRGIITSNTISSQRSCLALVVQRSALPTRRSSKSITDSSQFVISKLAPSRSAVANRWGLTLSPILWSDCRKSCYDPARQVGCRCLGQGGCHVLACASGCTVGCGLVLRRRPGRHAAALLLPSSSLPVTRSPRSSCCKAIAPGHERMAACSNVYYLGARKR